MLCGVVSTYGQGHFTLGIKGGVNMANLDGGSSTALYEQRTGFHVGAFTAFGVGRIALQPEIQFSSQGALYKEVGGLSNAVEKFNYVNIPVLLRYYLLNRLYVQAGPQFGFLREAYEYTGNTREDVLHLYDRSEVSLGMGVGLKLPMGITLEGRYNMGLSDISDNPVVDEALRNQVYQLSIGLRFIDAGSKPVVK